MACARCSLSKYVVHVDVSPVLTAELLDHIKVSWSYLEEYSRVIIDNYDRDDDQNLSESELVMAQEGLWAEARANKFYFILSAEGEWLPIQGGRNPFLAIKDSLVEMSFEIVVGQPIEDQSVFKLFFSDESGETMFFFSMAETSGSFSSGPWKLAYSISWSDMLTITVLNQASAQKGFPALNTVVFGLARKD